MFNSCNVVPTCCIGVGAGGNSPRGTWWPFWSLGPPREGPFCLQLLMVLLMMSLAAVFTEVDDVVDLGVEWWLGACSLSSLVACNGLSQQGS